MDTPMGIRIPAKLIQMIDEEAQSQERSRPQQIRFILSEWYKAKNGTKTKSRN